MISFTASIFIAFLLFYLGCKATEKTEPSILYLEVALHELKHASPRVSFCLLWPLVNHLGPLRQPVLKLGCKKAGWKECVATWKTAYGIMLGTWRHHRTQENVNWMIVMYFKRYIVERTERNIPPILSMMKLWEVFSFSVSKSFKMYLLQSMYLLEVGLSVSVIQVSSFLAIVCLLDFKKTGWEPGIFPNRRSTEAFLVQYLSPSPLIFP